MITSLRVSNYRSLGQDVELRLGPLTVLVGPNGSGKSNVVDVLRFVSEALQVGLEGAVTKRHGIRAVRRWSSGKPFHLSLALEIGRDEWKGGYSLTLKGDATEEYSVKSEAAWLSREGQIQRFQREGQEWLEGPSELRPRVDALNLALPLIAGDERFRPLVDFIRGMTMYSVFPDVLREPQKYDPVIPMKEHGGNWVSILKDPRAKAWKNELLAALGKLTGDLEDFEVRTAGGYLIVRFKHKVEGKRAKWFDAAQESDGTLRMAGILTALLQDPQPTVIGIEEPELTVHPGALPMLCEFIREASQENQIILTTHSPEFLDEFEDDAVRVVERCQGETTVAPLDEEQRKMVADRLLTLGEVLRTEGLKQQLELTA